MHNFRQLIDPLSFFPLILSIVRQMVGRILVEIFRSAANTDTKLPVEEYMKYVHQISDDPDQIPKMILSKELTIQALTLAVIITLA
ncbi:hypothetical protein HZH68_002401 [Vespula germanica]|uniref:Uncharacterized protein n=1 Tax=Vespula germanica TaxID=30212 RepID=A0A834NM90_VESGE|nr:hypothetical protein HZH68_002401 [Vespula germanica]